MIKSLRFDTFEPGPHLVVLGAVHGDEKCGTIAIQRLVAALEAGDVVLQKGTLTCVPIANPRAYELNTRFCERNLNRALYPKEHKQYYEDSIDPILCSILNQADVLIDLHSFASQGDAFGFLGHSSEAEIELCRALTIHDFVYGWSDAFGQILDDPRDGMGTVEYARSQGAIATTIECGHHLNEDAPQVGYQVLLAGLLHLGMIAGDKTSVSNQRFVQMSSVYMKAEEGQPAQPWKHYDAVTAGQLLATYESGETITAPEDGYIILPKLHADIGGEWFYFGVETSCPTPISRP